MPGSKIPFFGLDRQYANLRDELLDVADRVWSSGQVLDGPYTEKFEQAIALRCERRFAVTVNSCSQGLIFAQMALGLNQTRILIPTVSFVATLNSVFMANNEPRFCDVDDRALLDFESLDYALKGTGVGGVMYVNIFGNCVDYNKLRLETSFFNEHIPIIEDAAQSFGASRDHIPSGKMGDVSVLSFDPTKNLPAYGSGGMVLTDDADIYTRLMDIRNNGKASGFYSTGTNSKMSESECAQLIVKLKYFDGWQKRRTEIADFYTQELLDWVDPILPDQETKSAWHKYVIRTPERNGIRQHLASFGIETRIHYETPLYEYPVAQDFVDYATEVFRVGHAHSVEALSLPIYPEMTDAEVEAVVEAIQDYLR
jgi:dTDP-4-amino-4,6-dideoxygalactose transaminase